MCASFKTVLRILVLWCFVLMETSFRLPISNSVYLDATYCIVVKNRTIFFQQKCAWQYSTGAKLSRNVRAHESRYRKRSWVILKILSTNRRWGHLLKLNIARGVVFDLEIYDAFTYSALITPPLMAWPRTSVRTFGFNIFTCGNSSSSISRNSPKE